MKSEHNPEIGFSEMVQPVEPASLRRPEHPHVPVRVARSDDEITTATHVAIRTIRLFFQRAPGTRAGLGIEGLAVEVLNGGRTERYRTDHQGCVSFHLPVGSQAGVVVYHPENRDNAVMTFVVSPRLSLPPIDAPGFQGVRCRLNHLGYNAGREASTSMDGALERAVLNFQVDQRLPVNGVTGGPAERIAAPPVSVPQDVLDALQSVMRQESGEIESTSGRPPYPHDDNLFLMPFNWARLTLVRFTRAIRPGTPDVANNPIDGTNPDLDERGFPAAVGMLRGPEHRIFVRLVREERMNNLMTLHVKSSNPGVVNFVEYRQSVAEVLRPPRMEEILCPDKRLESVASTDIELHGVSHGNADVEVRLHDGAGPIIHILRVHVFNPITVRVAVFVVDPPHVGMRVGSERIYRLFDLVNEHFAPAGVVLEVVNDPQREITYTIPFQGQQFDIRQIFRLRHYPDSVNVYIVPNSFPFEDPMIAGIGIPSDYLPGMERMRGVIVREGAFDDPHIMAHECCHVFGLQHTVGPTNSYDTTIWGLQRLMGRFAGFIPLDLVQPWHSIGHGTALASTWLAGGRQYQQHGSLLTLKDLRNSGEDFDNEVWRIREFLRNGVYDGVRYQDGRLLEGVPA